MGGREEKGGVRVRDRERGGRWVRVQVDASGRQPGRRGQIRSGGGFARSHQLRRGSERQGERRARGPFAGQLVAGHLGPRLGQFSGRSLPFRKDERFGSCRPESSGVHVQVCAHPRRLQEATSAARDAASPDW